MTRLRPGQILALFWLLAAAMLRFALLGYSFSALLCLGLAGITFLIDTLLRKRHTRLLIALTALLAVGVVLFLVAEIPILRESRGSGEAEPDYLIVLGAGVTGDTPSLSMLDRLVATEAFLDEHPDCIAIVSGGQGDGEHLSEAQAMWNYLTAQGVPEARIWMEDQATNTRENLQFSLEVLRSRGVDPETHALAVLSSEYHLYRAKLYALSMGVEVRTVPAHTSIWPLRVNYTLREAVAVWALWLFS